MKIGEMQVKEIYLDSSARMICAPQLIPSPGQYLLAEQRGAYAPAAIPVFSSESTPEGFLAAPALPAAWTPGARIIARGPIGHGFAVPPAARKIALIAFDDSPARLRGLIPIAFQQGAEVVLLCNASAPNLPESVEVQPMQALREILRWADFIAADLARENVTQFKTLISGDTLPEAQLLVRAPMPCGGLAECGVCASSSTYHWKMICKEGPVFKIDEI